MSGAISFRLDLPEELADCLTPKMILQPLVENAVLHGVDLSLIHISLLHIGLLGGLLLVLGLLAGDVLVPGFEPVGQTDGAGGAEHGPAAPQQGDVYKRQAPIIAIVEDTFKIHAGTIDAYLTGQSSGYTAVNYIDLFTSSMARSRCV